MADGVRVATAYVEILGDFSKLPEQIKDSLNKAGAQAKPAGKKIGKDIATGIDEGMKTAPSSSGGGGILSDVIRGKPVSGNVRDQAKKVGKEVGKGINEGVASAGKDVGGNILDGVRQAAKDAGIDLDKEIVSAAGKAGAKVGKALHDAFEGSFSGPVFKGLHEKIDGITDFTHKAADGVRSLNDAFTKLGGDSGQVLSGLQQAGKWLIEGDVKGTLSDIGNTVKSLSGANFSDLSSVLSNLKNTDLSGAVTGISNAIRGLQGKDVAGAVSQLSDALKTLGQNDAANTLDQINTKVGKTKDDFGTLRDNIKDTVGGFGVLELASPKLAAALGEIAGPIAAAVVALKEFNDLTDPGHGAGKNMHDWLKAHGLLPGETPNPPPGSGLPPPPPGSGQPPVDGRQIIEPPKPGQETPTQRLKRWLGLAAQGGDNPPAPPQGSSAPGTGLKAWQDYLGGGGATAVAPSGLTSTPGRASESGLQVNTIKANRALSAAFPEITNIGGVRPDALKWHPQGLALDVMIPGQGGLNDPTTPEGLALGNRIWSWMGQHASELGIDMGASLWQQKDHYNHIHLATTGGGYPSFDDGGDVMHDQTAQLHSGEHVLPKGDVDAMGGQQGVYAMRDALAKGGTGQDPLAGIRGALQDPQDPQQAKMLSDFARTIGYLPAAGATGGVAGTSSLAGLFNLGNQAVGGAIDIGASAAETAINMGISAAAGGGAAAGTMGAGAAAAPIAGAAAGAASNYLIQLGATELKRLSSYGFQLGAIGADALVEQLFPFGAPRWLGYDYTQFLPQLNISQVGVTTAEKAVQAAMSGQQQGGDVAGVSTPLGPGAANGGAIPAAQQPGGPVAPEHLPGSQLTGPPTPGLDHAPGVAPPGPPGGTPGTGPAGGGPAPFTPGAPGGPAPTAAPGAGGVTQDWRDAILPGASAQQQFPQGATGLSLIPTYDEGGTWPSGTLGVNMSGRPELVLSPSQIDQMSAAPPSRQGGDVIIQHLTATDANDVAKQIAKQQRLQMMRHSSRPGP